MSVWVIASVTNYLLLNSRIAVIKYCAEPRGFNCNTPEPRMTPLAGCLEHPVVILFQIVAGAINRSPPCASVRDGLANAAHFVASPASRCRLQHDSQSVSAAGLSALFCSRLACEHNGPPQSQICSRPVCGHLALFCGLCALQTSEDL